jgi:hypothetical protein
LTRIKLLPCLALLAPLAAALHAQTVDDGIMIARHDLFVGSLYTNDSWDHYWEGHLKRNNGNLGTVTTQTSTMYADYGVINRLDLIASVPYIWTNASQGVLHGMQGYQNATLAAKYNFINRPLTELGDFKAIAVVTGVIPITNYEPDFQPLSIGNQSKQISSRLTLNFQAKRGWYVNASSAYTWRDDVKLDVPYYYTNGQFYMTNDVSMPGVFDYILAGGYRKHHVLAEGNFSQQRTQGGGDIRRQDLPFISNHINYSKVGMRIMYEIPKVRTLTLQFAFSYIADGRNIGQSETYTTGLMYTFALPGSPRRHK